nr:Retrovirus-related Pol polyprotein from transposon TNT 1-94 [Ipomoea batatas]
MSLEISENFIVRLNGKNYSAWAFQFELFVKGKELWSHINGSDSAPDKEKEKEKYAKWEVKDAQIMSWILGSVEPSILINLKPYKTSRGMWDYLKKVYIQNNSARRFQLELELGQLSQGSMSIQEFYSSFETLWVEYTDIVYANVPPEGLSAVQSVHETSKRDQFLMKLRGEFETIRSNLMNRELVPSMDICVGELLKEEQRLTTLAVLEQKAQNSAPIPVAYAAQTRPNRGRDMTNVQCYSCKNFGHFATNCTKKFCNYCKKAGHIIKECSIRPPKKHETAYNVSVGPSTASNAGQSTITPEMVQQMIVSALSAFGLSGNNNSDSKPWYFDSGASHHMTNTALPLKNVQKYSGDLQIHTADGNSLPITAVGDISASLNNVFVSPKLSTNLISVGQLVDSNCTVQFSKSGCFVQDQVSGKMIAKGPKVGRLFPLFLSPPPVSNYVACNAVQSLTSAPSHQPATTDSVLPSSIDPPPLRRSSRPHKPVESSAVQQIAVVLCRQQ